MENILCLDLEQAVEALELQELKGQFQVQNEFLVIENFLPPSLLDQFLAQLPVLHPAIHRNYIPRHKKGGSISRFDLDDLAPIFAAFYASPVLLSFLKQLTAEQLLLCPDVDPHSYALYYYTEPGDHIQYHYDTSYYQGKRYTVLIGLVDQSSSKLEYQLYPEDAGRKAETGRLRILPGTLVIFNGDHIYHRVTPLGEHEQRIVLTLEYVTNIHMTRMNRFISNMKDAIAYFGFSRVFSQGNPKSSLTE